MELTGKKRMNNTEELGKIKWEEQDEGRKAEEGRT